MKYKFQIWHLIVGIILLALLFNSQNIGRESMFGRGYDITHDGKLYSCDSNPIDSESKDYDGKTSISHTNIHTFPVTFELFNEDWTYINRKEVMPGDTKSFTGLDSSKTYHKDIYWCELAGEGCDGANEGQYKCSGEGEISICDDGNWDSFGTCSNFYGFEDECKSSGYVDTAREACEEAEVIEKSYSCIEGKCTEDTKGEYDSADCDDECVVSDCHGYQTNYVLIGDYIVEEKFSTCAQDMDCYINFATIEKKLIGVVLNIVTTCDSGKMSSIDTKSIERGSISAIQKHICFYHDDCKDGECIPLDTLSIDGYISEEKMAALAEASLGLLGDKRFELGICILTDEDGDIIEDDEKEGTDFCEKMTWAKDIAKSIGMGDDYCMVGLIAIMVGILAFFFLLSMVKPK